MPNIVCRRKITCPGTDDPIANLSSEDEETNNWQSVGYCCDGTIKTASSDVSCEVAEALLQDALNNDCPECPDEDGAAAITLNGIDDHICQYAAYGSQVTANTASDTLFFELYDGSLPTGLEFHGGETTCGSALIDGAAQEAGDFTFSIRVCDDSGNCAERTYTISVLGITNQPPPDGTTGGLYSWIPNVVGGSGNYDFALLGDLPTGLIFSTVNGSISGIPTEDGDFTVSIVVTDTTTGISCPIILQFTIEHGTGTDTCADLFGATDLQADPLLVAWINAVRAFYAPSDPAAPLTLYNLSATGTVPPGPCSWVSVFGNLLVTPGCGCWPSARAASIAVNGPSFDVSVNGYPGMNLNYTPTGDPSQPTGHYALDLGSSYWPSTPLGAPPSSITIS